MRPHSRRGSGFTLIELLVVIAILGTLVGLMLPALSRTRSTASRVVCLSNQRQMMLAATMYVDSARDHFMPALYVDFSGTVAERVGWDFVEVFRGEAVEIEPGALWAGTDAGEVMQCPSMEGAANWTDATDAGDPYTGYNYNTSYIGGPTVGPDPANPAGDGPRWSSNGQRITASARLFEIADPSWTVVFGDGAFGAGANKFMRAPWRGTRDSDVGRAAHAAGAQGFLHDGSSNGVMADGHGTSFGVAHTETYAEGRSFLAERAGFLSPGNGVYDLSPGR